MQRALSAVFVRWGQVHCCRVFLEHLPAEFDGFQPGINELFHVDAEAVVRKLPDESSSIVGTLSTIELINLSELQDAFHLFRQTLALLSTTLDNIVDLNSHEAFSLCLWVSGA